MFRIKKKNNNNLCHAILRLFRKLFTQHFFLFFPNGLISFFLSLKPKHTILPILLSISYHQFMSKLLSTEINCQKIKTQKCPRVFSRGALCWWMSIFIIFIASRFLLSFFEK
uniref:Uncharacterized protein n=1 Tax=Cacopsylla melanoneura TaxID=428564 RepID=A0A8D9BGS7_9HEMI